MKMLVIGGSGFIGSHLVDRLLAHGHSVRVLARRAETLRESLGHVDYHLGDFRDKALLAEALIGVEAVYHLVSTTLPGTADLDPKSDIQDNLIGAINLFESMHALGVRRIIFLSSGGTVYGTPEVVRVPESHPLRPISSYGIIKATIEHYLEMYRRTRQFSPIIVRASNPFGPRQGHSGVHGLISTSLRRVLAGEPIEIWGDGSIVRDYFYVADLAEFCARAGPSRHEGAYNVGSGRGMSVNEIVAAIRKITGSRSEPVYRPARAIDIPYSVLDCSRAKRDFVWECDTDFETALRMTWDWLQDHAQYLHNEVVF